MKTGNILYIVKRAKYVGAQAAQLNTYVTLKLQNVKSTTVTVKGSEPCWEQDFLFETNNVNSGLLVEVWTKGMIWDRALGYQLIPLDTIPYSTEDSQGQWYPLDMDIILMDGEVAGTKNPTGHMILLDCRFELPFDPETHPGDLQRKLELLNGMMTHDRRHRQAQYLGNSGYSEDSDYTSDLNYPVGQNANSSASQYRNLRTPQRSLETSRENSYEKDDRSSYYDCYSGDNKQNMTSYSPQDYYCKDENDPLSYNSRPMSSINFNKSSYGQTTSMLRKRSSLERQDTLYDDYGECYSNDNMYQDSNDRYGFCDANSDNLSEDRQWDSGGRGTSMNKILPKVPIKHSSSMVDGIYHRGASLPPTPPTSHKKTRLLPQPAGASITITATTTITTPTTITGGGKSLPSTPRMLPQLKTGKKMPPTPTTQRTDNNLGEFDSYSSHSQYSEILDKQPTSSSLITAYNVRPYTSVSVINYNEDYNYAYNSTDSLNQTFSDVISRRKGAALPVIPSIITTSATSSTTTSTSKAPKIGLNQNNNYNSLSFEYEQSSPIEQEFYGNTTTTDDYFFDNSLTNSSMLTNFGSTTSTQSVSRKIKKLPVPITSTPITATTAVSSGYSTPTFGGTRVGSRLPQIPITTTFIAATTTSMSLGKLLPSTPILSSYDNLYSSIASQSNDYFDDYGSSTTTTCSFPTLKTDSNKDYEYNLYNNTYCTTIPTVATTQTTSSTIGGYYKPTCLTSSITHIESSSKTTTSALDNITTGFKATVGGVVGGVGAVTATSSSTGTSSLTSTAKSYLGLASKFLPNLTGGASTVTTSSTKPLSTTITDSKTIMSSVSSYGLNRSNLCSSNKYNDVSDYSNRYNESDYYYNNYNNSIAISSNNTILSSSSALYSENSGFCSITGTIMSTTTTSSSQPLPSTTTSTTAPSISTTALMQDKSNYNSYFSGNTLDNYNSSLQYSNQSYVDNNDSYQYNEDDIAEYNPYITSTESFVPAITASTDTVKSTAFSSTTSTVPTTRVGNIVDYSDYKYGYDEYSCSENDYIATGDITDKQNYNNNYDIYDITSSSTTVYTSTSTTTTSTVAGLSVYDYNSGYISNKSSIYCDNSSNLITSTVAVTSTILSTTIAVTTAGGTGLLTQNKTGHHMMLDQNNSLSSVAVTTTTTNNSTNNYITNVNMYGTTTPTTATTTIMSNFMDQKISSTTAITTQTTSTTPLTNTGKRLPMINGKSSLLIKQQPTEIYEEDELATRETNQDQIDNENDEYYMDSHPQTMSAVTTASIMSSNNYYDSTYGTNDTPYYDYREDYFNEEDEYKYLEKEQEQQQKHQVLLQHQKQPPLEFIEESHDDYIDDPVGDHSVDSFTNTTQHNQSIKQLDENKTKYSQLATQETIDDACGDYILDQQSHQSLKKQDSIIEEDEEPIPSPTEMYDKKESSSSTGKPQLQSQLSSDTMIEEDIKKKTITRGETEEVTSGQIIRKAEVTARQRWHWAYNKIIMQLNEQIGEKSG